jgi:hypothetical protein
MIRTTEKEYADAKALAVEIETAAKAASIRLDKMEETQANLGATLALVLAAHIIRGRRGK